MPAAKPVTLAAMANEIVLRPDELVPGRPFTDPANTRADERALRRLLSHLRRRARRWARERTAGGAVVLRETDAAGHRHLLVVPDTEALLETCDLTVVGFFGRPRADADAALLFGLEDELVQGMHAYAAHGLLTYYDVELVKDKYGNLILFSSPDGPLRWRENEVHRRAVEISPRNYPEIRLHQGLVPGRLLEPGVLRVWRTRYIAYDDGEVWRAVRSFEPDGDEPAPRSAEPA